MVASSDAAAVELLLTAGANVDDNVRIKGETRTVLQHLTYKYCYGDKDTLAQQLAHDYRCIELLLAAGAGGVAAGRRTEPHVVSRVSCMWCPGAAPRAPRECARLTPFGL